MLDTYTLYNVYLVPMSLPKLLSELVVTLSLFPASHPPPLPSPPPPLLSPHPSPPLPSSLPSSPLTPPPPLPPPPPTSFPV